MLNEAIVKADPATSFWLKEQLATTAKRDVIDAIRDTEILLSLLHQRLSEHSG